MLSSDWLLLIGCFLFPKQTQSSKESRCFRSLEHTKVLGLSRFWFCSGENVGTVSSHQFLFSRLLSFPLSGRAPHGALQPSDRRARL